MALSDTISTDTELTTSPCNTYISNSTAYLLDLAAGLPTVLQQSTGGDTTHLYGAGLLGQDDGTNAGLQTLLPDALGSTRLVATDGGAVVGHSSYDAYGAQSSTVRYSARRPQSYTVTMGMMTWDCA